MPIQSHACRPMRRKAPAGAPVASAILRGLCLLAVLAFAVFFPRDAHAYAWMLKHGYTKCNSCHTDPSGGETLTHMGRVQSDLLLSAGAGPEGEFKARSKFLFGAIKEPDNVRLGGSLRVMSIFKLPKDEQESDFSLFPMQADFYGTAMFGAVWLGGSIGYANVPAGSPHLQAAQLTTGADGPNAISRTHFVGVEFDEGYLLRLGRLNLPFGVRIPEHVMWVREATRTDRESDQQHGVAFSVTRGKWRSELMAIAGNYQVNPDEFRERGYSGYVEHSFSPTFALGINSLWTKARRDRLALSTTGYVRNAHGLTGRFGLSPKLAILAEADILKSTGRKLGYVAMVQGDYEFKQGLHGMVTLELLDQGKSKTGEALPGAGKLRHGLWLTGAYYFLSHLDARVEAVIRKEDPVTLQAQLHLWF